VLDKLSSRSAECRRGQLAVVRTLIEKGGAYGSLVGLVGPERDGRDLWTKEPCHLGTPPQLEVAGCCIKDLAVTETGLRPELHH
jgi:hypothetical protein